MTDLLFAYGTLNPELAPPEIAPIVGRFVRLGPATVIGRLFDLGPYRGAVLEPVGGKPITGTLYRVPEFAIFAPALDAYEGIDPLNESLSLFTRRQAAAEFGGKTVDAWIYVYNGDTSGLTPING